MDDKIRKLKEIVDHTDNLVFFGGAGVSTESGIPDFRSTDGLYNMKYKYPPETIVSLIPYFSSIFPAISTSFDKLSFLGMIAP